MNLFTKPTADTVIANPLLQDASELSHRMRYSGMLRRSDLGTLHHELMLGATFIDNFADLLRMPAKRRNRVIAALKRAALERAQDETKEKQP